MLRVFENLVCGRSSAAEIGRKGASQLKRVFRGGARMPRVTSACAHGARRRGSGEDHAGHKRGVPGLRPEAVRNPAAAARRGGREAHRAGAEAQPRDCGADTQGA